MAFVCLIVKASTSILTPSNISADSFEDIFEGIVERFKNHNFVSGAVSVNYNGKNIFESIKGFSDISKQTKANRETLYHWSSISSVLAHVSIMQLYEEGKLNLTDDIKKYLGKKFFKRLSYNDTIRIINLMNHDTGWDETAEKSIVHGNKIKVNLENVIRKNEPQQFCRPGTFVSFSDYGVAVEGLIVEKVSKMKYWKYVRMNILKRLGMNMTSVDPQRNDISEDMLRNMAKPYALQNEDMRIIETEIFSNQFYPSGSVISTISDMSKFVDSLIWKEGTNNIFKNKETYIEFYNISKESARISHGLFQQIYSDKIIGYDHQGKTIGYTAFMSILPDQGFSYVGVSNIQDDFVISRAFHRKLWGIYVPKTDINISSNLSGKYRPTAIVYRGFFMRHDLDKIYSLDVLERNNQFSFRGEIYSISEFNLFTNNASSNGSYIGKYQIRFIKDSNLTIIGLCNFDECYEKVNEINKYEIPLVIYIFEIFIITTSLIFFIGELNHRTNTCFCFKQIIIMLMILLICTSSFITNINLLKNRICIRTTAMNVIYILIFIICCEVILSLVYFSLFIIDFTKVADPKYKSPIGSLIDFIMFSIDYDPNDNVDIFDKDEDLCSEDLCEIDILIFLSCIFCIFYHVRMLIVNEAIYL